MDIIRFQSKINSLFYQHYLQEGILTGTSKLLLWVVAAEKATRCLKVFLTTENNGKLKQYSTFKGHFHTNLFATAALCGTLSLNIIPGSARGMAATYLLWIHLNSFKYEPNKSSGERQQRLYNRTNDFCDRIIRLPGNIFRFIYRDILFLDQNRMIFFWSVIVLPATLIAAVVKYRPSKIFPKEISW